MTKLFELVGTLRERNSFSLVEMKLSLACLHVVCDVINITGPPGESQFLKLLSNSMHPSPFISQSLKLTAVSLNC